MNINAANLAVAQQSAMINTGEDKLEQLKKQIDHLKRCINWPKVIYKGKFIIVKQVYYYT